MSVYQMPCLKEVRIFVRDGESADSGIRKKEGVFPLDLLLPLHMSLLRCDSNWDVVQPLCIHISLVF